MKDLLLSDDFAFLRSYSSQDLQASPKCSVCPRATLADPRVAEAELIRHQNKTAQHTCGKFINRGYSCQSSSYQQLGNQYFKQWSNVREISLHLINLLLFFSVHFKLLEMINLLAVKNFIFEFLWCKMKKNTNSIINIQ